MVDKGAGVMEYLGYWSNGFRNSGPTLHYSNRNFEGALCLKI
jgi:hypothetical protein